MTPSKAARPPRFSKKKEAQTRAMQEVQDAMAEAQADALAARKMFAEYHSWPSWIWQAVEHRRACGR